MICPRCNSAIDQVRIWLVSYQYATIDEDGMTGDRTCIRYVEKPHSVQCPKCYADIIDDVSVR